MRYLGSGLVIGCALIWSVPAAAQTSLTATFSRGAIAEYSNNPNGTDNGVLFSTLGITSMSISQSSSTGSWGGTQGNDTAVTAKIIFTNGTSVNFPAAINWVKNAGGGQFDWIGVTLNTGTTVADGYNLSAGMQKTYILEFPQSALNLSTLLPNGLDGSANTGAALNALNQYFPTAVASPPVITGPSGGAGASASALSVNENQTAVTTLTANKAVTWSITGGTDLTKFSISAGGVITFIAAPDHEVPTDSDTNNTYVLTVAATDSNGSTATHTITVTVLDLDDTAPIVAVGQTLSYTENQIANATVGTVAASDAVGVAAFRFAGTGTQTSADGFYTIDNLGVLRITAVGAATGVANNDFETAPNSFNYAVQATDAAGNLSTSTTISLNVADLPDTAPVITGPGGANGASSAISVPEGTTAVTTLTANVPVSSWAIVGGNDQGRFTVSPSGQISFVAAPDYEAPTDSDTNNTYVLTVEATDANGNVAQQTVTVTVTDVADTPPAITGPGGSAGAASSAITVNEGTSAVTTVSANVPVTWAISGGNDAGRFAISPSGAINFVATPDYEAPTDSDANNTYVLTITATDANGNFSAQTLTVTVVNVDELRRKLGEISPNLRRDLRNQVFSSLSSMLAFNEGLLGATQDSCANGGKLRTVSGRLNAIDEYQDANMKFRRDLTSCQARTRLFVDGGVSFTRVNKNWTTRGLASLRVEQQVGHDVVLGAALIGTGARDDLSSFANSQITDMSLQLNVYGRAQLSDKLRLAGFGGWGKTRYDFRINEEGFTLRGKMDGTRHLYGVALSGDIPLGSLTLTTDAILSRAIEKLGSASFDASYFEESGSNMLIRLGSVDITRLSVPIHVPIVFGSKGNGKEPTRLELSPGLLCQDTTQDSSAFDCGYQFGFKFQMAPSSRSRLRAQAHYELVDGYAASRFALGLERRFGSANGLAFGINLERQKSASRQDNRFMLHFGVSR